MTLTSPEPSQRASIGSTAAALARRLSAAHLLLKAKWLRNRPQDSMPSERAENLTQHGLCNAPLVALQSPRGERLRTVASSREFVDPNLGVL